MHLTQQSSSNQQSVEFLTDLEILNGLKVFKKQLGNREDLNYVLKLEAKGCNDMELLNERASFVRQHHRGPLVLESTFERLVLVARLENSVFLSTNVHPALRYLLMAGDEEACLAELAKFKRNLEVEFADLSVMCTIALDRINPASWPNLGVLMNYFRESPSFWRFVVFSPERVPVALATLTRLDFS